MKKIANILMWVLAFVASGAAIWLAGLTILSAALKWVAWIVPLLFSAGLFYWLSFRYNNTLIDRILWVVSRSVLFASALFSLLFGFNYLGVSEGNFHTVSGTVVVKKRIEHTNYRRVSRNHHVPAGKWYSYEFVVQLPDSTKITHPTTLESYNRTRRGSTIKVDVARGRLGWPVVRW